MKVTIKGFIHKSAYTDGFMMASCDMTEFGHLMVVPHEFEFDIPDTFNPVAAEIEVLEKKLADVSDKFMEQSRAIKSRIADLKCLPAPGCSYDYPGDEVKF